MKRLSEAPGWWCARFRAGGWSFRFSWSAIGGFPRSGGRVLFPAFGYEFRRRAIVPAWALAIHRAAGPGRRFRRWRPLGPTTIRAVATSVPVGLLRASPA